MDLFKKAPHLHTRWASFENPTAGKGEGAKTNRGAKGFAFDSIEAGDSRTLLDVQGPGTVRRMWFTLGPRTPKTLRGLRLEMTWDGADKPAVSVPFGDFFGYISGTPTPPFENESFASPEAKSYVCYIPMPFRKGAKITVTNESDQKLVHFFYDIEITQGDQHDENTLYFHAAWRRERFTKVGRDFEILPKIEGEGRFIGSHLGVMVNPVNDGWWGEGEIKMYLDGDAEHPSLVGTGTEDYISTGWGQGVFMNRFHGSFVSDGEKKKYTFYRYHIPDPVYFHSDIRVCMQQIGGTMKGIVQKMVDDGCGDPANQYRSGRQVHAPAGHRSADDFGGYDGCSK